MVFSLLFFVVLFIIFYFIYYFIFDDMLKKEKYTKITELVFLTKVYNLDKKKMNYRTCLNGVAIMNAFIIAFTITLVDALPINIVFSLIIAFVVLMIMIYFGYKQYGKYLNKKWGKKNGI